MGALIYGMGAYELMCTLLATPLVGIDLGHEHDIAVQRVICFGGGMEQVWV